MVKRAVSVSLGSPTRDKQTEIDLLGHRVTLCREGWNGDAAAVRRRFTELDGQVDALGVGGVDLWLYSDHGRHKFVAGHRLVAGVSRTPVVDGSGLKNTLETQVVPVLRQALGTAGAGRRVLLTAAIDRFGMARSFFDHGYEVLCGEIGFALGLPIPIRSRRGLARLARILVPIVTRLPVSLIYPTGSKQLEIRPKFQSWYQWANVIAGDCLFIKRHLPDDLEGKIIVTNTTTVEDRALFAARGVRALLTTTPVFDGRSFGTNMLEAGLTAAAGKGRPMTPVELEALLTQLDIRPVVSLLDRDE